MKEHRKETNEKGVGFLTKLFIKRKEVRKMVSIKDASTCHDTNLVLV